MTKDEAILILVRSAICSRSMCDNCQYNFAPSIGSEGCAYDCICDFTYESVNEAMDVLGYSFTDNV